MDRTGCMVFVVEGRCEGGKARVNEKTGERTFGFNVSFWGGEQFLTLDDATQERHIQRGAWLRCEAKCVTFKETTYPGRARITHVEGKAVDNGGEAFKASAPAKDAR